MSDNPRHAQLIEQYELPWQMQRDMIVSQTPLSEKMVNVAVGVAKSFGLPLQGINVIPSKMGPRIYVNSDGVRYRLHTDERGVKESTFKIMQWPTEQFRAVAVEATVTLGDGSTFTNVGVVDCNPEDSKNLPNAVMKAVTKAKRRAGVDAVGVALPVFDEDWVETRTAYDSISRVNGGAPVSQVDDVPLTLPAFLTWAKDFFAVDNTEKLSIIIGTPIGEINRRLQEEGAEFIEYVKALKGTSDKDNTDAKDDSSQ